jgi:hypothetical protein
MSRANIGVSRYPGGSPSYTADQLPSYSGGNGEIWTPANLYAGDGDWYLATDLTTLFQDSAKTTAAAANSDPIGAWVGQMGVGPDITQATGANKPLLFVSGGETAVGFPATTNVWLIGTLSPAIAYTDDWSMWAVMRKVTAQSTDAHPVPRTHDSTTIASTSRNRLCPVNDVSETVFGRAAFRAGAVNTNSATTSDQFVYRLSAMVTTTSGTAGYLYTGTSAAAATIGTATAAQNGLSIGSNGTLYGGANIIAVGYIRRSLSAGDIANLSAWAVTQGAQF